MWLNLPARRVKLATVTDRTRRRLVELARGISARDFTVVRHPVSIVSAYASLNPGMVCLTGALVYLAVLKLLGAEELRLAVRLRQREQPAAFAPN